MQFEIHHFIYTNVMFPIGFYVPKTECDKDAKEDLFLGTRNILVGSLLDDFVFIWQPKIVPVSLFSRLNLGLYLYCGLTILPIYTDSPLSFLSHRYFFE